MKTFIVAVFLLVLAAPALAQHQTVILDQQGRPAVLGNKDDSGNIIYYDLNQGQPTYWGQEQGNQTYLYPFPDQAQPLENGGYRAPDMPRTPQDVLNER